MKPNKRPRRFTDVFVPFANFASAIRDKLRGLRNLPNSAIEGAGADKKTASGVVRDGKIRKRTPRTGFKTTNDKKTKASSVSRLNAKETRPKKTFIAFKAASKKRPATMTTLSTITNELPASDDVQRQINATDKANESPQQLLEKRKRASASATTATGAASESMKKFLDKKKRLRDIDSIIHKRSGGIKFTPIVGRDRSRSRTRSESDQSDSAPVAASSKSRIETAVVTAASIRPSIEPGESENKSEHELRTRTYLIDQQRRRRQR